VIALTILECVQECTSEFISFITSEASDKATAEKRKTITGDDILNALKSLGFEDLSDVLFIYLARYRTVRCNDHLRWSFPDISCQLQRNEPSRKRQRKSKKDTNGLSASTAKSNGHADENGNEEEEDNEDEQDEEDDAEPKPAVSAT
jgi:hypothetical protein